MEKLAARVKALEEHSKVSDNRLTNAENEIEALKRQIAALSDMGSNV